MHLLLSVGVALILISDVTGQENGATEYDWDVADVDIDAADDVNGATDVMDADAEADEVGRVKRSSFNPHFFQKRFQNKFSVNNKKKDFRRREKDDRKLRKEQEKRRRKDEQERKRKEEERRRKDEKKKEQELRELHGSHDNT